LEARQAAPRFSALPQKACYVPLSVKNTENLKGLAAGFVDHEVGENPVEENVLAGEIGAAVAAVWDVSQLIEASEELSDDPVRRLQALLVQEVKPDGIDVEDGIVG
jgi:hypothetical protein